MGRFFNRTKRCALKTFIHIIIVSLVWVALPSAVLADNRLTELKNIHQLIKNKQVTLLQNQPLTIQSKISDNKLHAEVFSVKKYAFPKMVEKLSGAKQWCKFITLHLNIKACIYRSAPNQSLNFFAGRKFYEPAESAYELKYHFEIEKSTDEYFKLNLSADEGPFGTQDYLIVLELFKVDSEVVIHMSLSYLSSFSSRLGTSVYLSTIGADKIGFSQIKNIDGKLEYIQGIEGIIERNVMRYYLALSVYLDEDDKHKLAQTWFDETEKYSKQLHEVEREAYLDAKALEFKQQYQMQQRLDKGLSVIDFSTDAD